MKGRWSGGTVRCGGMCNGRLRCTLGRCGDGWDGDDGGGAVEEGNVRSGYMAILQQSEDCTGIMPL